MLIGKKSKVKFNAIAFISTDKNGKDSHMVGIFKEKVFSPSNRSGWFVFDKFVDEIQSLTSSKVETVLGTLRKQGKVFSVFLDKEPEATDIVTDDGKTKLRFNVRNSIPVAFEY